jgi:hypothetical protein
LILASFTELPQLSFSLALPGGRVFFAWQRPFLYLPRRRGCRRAPKRALPIAAISARAPLAENHHWRCIAANSARPQVHIWQLFRVNCSLVKQVHWERASIKVRHHL